LIEKLLTIDSQRSRQEKKISLGKKIPFLRIRRGTGQRQRRREEQERRGCEADENGATFFCRNVERQNAKICNVDIKM
jgi:hypothetical protein